MKTIRIFSLVAFLMTIANFSFAQDKTESFKVSGNCGMCKNKIEKAAKEAGASTASWDSETKQLTVKYKSASTNPSKIQKTIAAVGYDNVGFKATDEAYNKLHGCCKYDRAESADKDKESCCSMKGDHKCEMKDGNCTDMTACKDKGCCDKEGKCKAGSCSHD